MPLAEKLERLARRVPGVAGYQDREKSRDTDRAVRSSLAEALEEEAREIEEEKRLLAERRDLTNLPALDRLTSRFGELANTIRYAPRGYRGWFDANQHIEKSLDDLYDFDLSLFTDVVKLRAFTEALREASLEAPKLKRTIALVSDALDEFEAVYRKRQALLE
jgi:hypothetical protein